MLNSHFGEPHKTQIKKPPNYHGKIVCLILKLLGSTFKNVVAFIYYSVIFDQLMSPAARKLKRFVRLLIACLPYFFRMVHYQNIVNKNRNGYFRASTTKHVWYMVYDFILCVCLYCSMIYQKIDCNLLHAQAVWVEHFFR